MSSTLLILPESNGNMSKANTKLRTRRRVEAWITASKDAHCNKEWYAK